MLYTSGVSDVEIAVGGREGGREGRGREGGVGLTFAAIVL